ncbi:MAG TPA: response regulator transcription factor [Candidatus Acidoferrales bacterium]|nr:response regulator transcription factor [Candidatus Acidoferrales bacterium]
MAKNILIADDNQLVRKLLRIMLERDAGWVVTEAIDGPDAIAKAQERKPDVVILDFAMPDMDGLNAAREILKICPPVPILLFTLYDSPETTLAAKAAGVSRVLPKTAAGLPLIRAVEELLAEEPPAVQKVPAKINEPTKAVANPPSEPNLAKTPVETRESPAVVCKGQAPRGASDGPDIKSE